MYKIVLSRANALYATVGLQTYLPIEILDYIQTHEPSIESVYGISQRELAKALGYHPCSMSRPLEALVAEGLLSVRRGMVRDGVRKQLTYRLTPTGLARLRRETREVPLLSGELPPPPHPFLGRKEELEHLASFSEIGSSVIVVEGPPGMGKTALVSRHLRRAKRGRVPFWYTVRPASSPRQFVTALAHALAFLGQPQLAYYAQLPRNPVARESADLAARALETRSLTAVIDDIHLAGTDLRSFLSDFVTALASHGAHQFYLVGQTAIEVGSGSLPIHHLSVGGLDRVAAHELTDRQGGLAERFESIYQVTNGSPLLLKLAVSQPGVIGGTSDLPAGVLRRLSDAETRVVLLAAVSNEPLPEQFLLEDRGVSEERLKELARIGVLQQSLHDRFEVLQVVRSAVLSSASAADRNEAHLRLARYYARSHRAETLRERFLHLVAGEDWKSGATLLESRERDILRLGYSQALRDAIRNLISGLSPGPAKVRVLFTEATLLRQHSDYSEAIQSLRLVMGETASDERVQREALLSIVDLELRLGHLDQAEAEFVRAQNIRATSRRLDAFVLLTEARMAEGRGESQRAADGYQRAFEGAKRVRASDLALESIAAWSKLAELTSGPGAALAVVESALPGARQSGRMDVVFNLRLVRARAFLESGRPDLAESEMVAIRSEAESLGYLNQLSYALSGLASVALERGQWTATASYARQASDLAERLGNQLVLGYTLAILCSSELRQADQGGNPELFQQSLAHGLRSVEVLQRLPPSDSLVLANGYLTELYLSLRKFSEASAHYNRALAVADELGLKSLKARVIDELGPKLANAAAGQVQATAESSAT